MSNVNVNAQGSQGDDLSKVLKMFEDYEKQDEKNKSYTKKEDILKKYFVPRDSREVFRPLPPQGNRDNIETAFFHVVQTNGPNGKKRWRKIYCSAHNDPPIPKKDSEGNVITDKEGNPVMINPPCPLCEKSKAILATQDSSLKGVKKEEMTPEQKIIKEKNDEIYKEAMKWAAKKFYIIRGIDKGKEKDGVKFWRFKHNYKKQGVFDKIRPALQEFMNENGVIFSDPERGCDLVISVVDNQIGNTGRTYRDVSSIMPKPPSKLHQDDAVVNAWVNDEMTWRDVFKKPSAPQLTENEYLERITRGVDPYWDDTDQNNKRWVFPDPEDAELQTKANDRSGSDLGISENPNKIERASDIQKTSNVSIENIKKEDVGEYEDDAVDLNSKSSDQEPKSSVEKEEKSYASVEDDSDGDDYDIDDLPF